MRSGRLAVLAVGLLSCGRTAPFGSERGSAFDPAHEGTCRGPLEVFSLQTLELDPEQAPHPYFAADGVVVFVEHPAPAEAERRPRLQRLELDTNRVETLAEGDLRIVDADARTVLFAEVGPAPEPKLVSLREGRRKEIGTAAPATREGGPGRNIDGDFIGACTSAWSLGVLDTRSDTFFQTLAQGGPCSEPIFTAGTDIVHLRHTDRGRRDEVVHWRATADAALATVVEEGRDLASPVLFEGRLVVISAGEVRARSLDGAPSLERIHQGPCSALDASAAGVVLACGGEGTPPVTAASSLLFYDGRQLRSIVSDGRSIVSPRLGDGFVAWLAYEPGVDLCSGGLDAGRVMVASLDGAQIEEVAAIDLGCLCCGAFWPEPFLTVRGDTLAFNYDASSEDLSTIRVGVARIRPACPSSGLQ